MMSGPCDTPLSPEQLMSVGVMDGVNVGRGVLDGVNVKVGGKVSIGMMFVAVLPVDGIKVEVKVIAIVGELVAVIIVGVMDGVLVSAANPVGMADPTMGMETRNVCALADTTSSGSIGMIEMIGS